MKVVILCGGHGTRIRDVSENIPKPMISIGGFPILWHIMKYYSTFGFFDFVLCLGYKSSVIKDFFIKYEFHMKDFTISLGGSKSLDFHNQHAETNWKITFAETGADAMTGSRIAQIKRYIGDQDFMLTYGDGLGDVDLPGLLSFHRSHGKVMTVTGVHPPGRFGELSHSKGVVKAFNEKPQVSSGCISGGFFVASPRLFDFLGSSRDTVLEEAPMRALVDAEELMVFEHEGFWHPMDTPRDYNFLNSLFDKGNAPWVRW